MIPSNLQLILIILSVLLLFIFISRIKSYKIELRYTILWIFVIFVNISLALFPYTLNAISELLYIETPVNTLFLFGILACFIILYSITATMSKFSIKIKQLTQEIGFLKNELEKYKKDDIVG